LNQAIEEALKSDYKQQIAAVIFKGKRIIAVAHNAVRSNKIPYKFKNFLESSHAECQAIIKARRSLKGYDILVIRLNRQGDLMMAKPCEFCQEFIDYVGIRNTFFSINSGEIFKLTVNSSSGNVDL
jgi:tRNA(Arg) A34 adenosine deaminase TadA